VTGHYIVAPQDNPQEWELKMDQLAFTPFEGHHSGANMASILLHTLDRYDIRGKVRLKLAILRQFLHPFCQAGWFTSDNASNNDMAMKKLAKLIDPLCRRWDPIQRRVR